MNDTLKKRILEFRDSRDWKKFHNPKDMALSLLLEASELVEHFQWKNIDIYYWLLLMSNDFDIDLDSALERKLINNEKKYPIEKCFGKSTKYNKL
jgi:NTP pyrophosphatase (non-canonical NTP hydrolase)